MEFALVKSASESELAFIAALDYGQDAERHLAALRAVCFEQGGVIRPDQYWFPYEVIELGAHSLREGHEREFAICTMLVLANVAARVDTSTDLQRAKKPQFECQQHPSLAVSSAGPPVSRAGQRDTPLVAECAHRAIERLHEVACFAGRSPAMRELAWRRRNGE